MVKGVIIQGARGGDSITAVEARAFVRKFKVSYSLNGKDWEYIEDPRTLQPKVKEFVHSNDNRVGYFRSRPFLQITGVRHVQHFPLRHIKMELGNI